MTPDINPARYDGWKSANPDDDGERERRLFQVADDREEEELEDDE